MRIVIDMQGAQSSGSRHRGIGRYTLSLTQAIVRNRGDNEVILALNGMFEESIESIRAAFVELLPQENIRVWQSPGPVSYINNENDWRRCTAELIREAFLASLKPDIVLVSSLCEGLGDDAVTSIGKLSDAVPTAVILYDLIPMIYPLIYQENPVVKSWYANKYDHLRRADLLLAISESSRQEGISHLGFSPEECVNISTASEPQFLPQQVDHMRVQEIYGRYGLNRPFVMYTGGIDYRKNIEGLIRAYSKLPKPLRESHQLAIVCSIQPQSRSDLEMLAKEHGLKADEIVLTGFVPEADLISLYNLCKVFIFPSWHEGFGLPVLEAMSCGRAVIAANTSSLPEVIGRDDALFDPMNDTSIAEKLALILTDDALRLELEQHGLARAKLFSWDTSAQRAIDAIQAWHDKKSSQALRAINTTYRPKLAYVSPLPPERSGISDYSAELLPVLSCHYEVDVIVAQDSISDPWIKANCPIHSVEWFRANSALYDRVVYHFGNSHFHQHMFSLLEEIPGVVVLHDFFLSGVAFHMEVTGYKPGFWTQELYQSHGYQAVKDRFHASDNEDVVSHYPTNLGVIQRAMGLIVHSENSLRMATQWYGDGADSDWKVIPLLRAPALNIDREKARHLLKLSNDDFVVCSFGFIGRPKNNHRLLEAWLASDLAQSKNSRLIFVGVNPNDDYGVELNKSIRQSGLAEQIHITGWTDAATFRHYLSAADVGVQLRTLSRGETSAAVLDCMNYGLATIVNANGSMADLPDDAVWKLRDNFDDLELTKALESLWRDKDRRQQMGERAKRIIFEKHDPVSCAEQYSVAIESFYKINQPLLNNLYNSIADISIEHPNDQNLILLSDSIAKSFPISSLKKTLLVDISVLIQHDAKTGIQRAVRSILKHWLLDPPCGWRIEPVYATNFDSYRYARQFTCSFLGIKNTRLVDDLIEFQSGDIFFALDFCPQIQIYQKNFYQKLRDQGLLVYFMVYDLLCITQPQNFEQGVHNSFKNWLDVVINSDGAVCISEAVAKDLSRWIEMQRVKHLRPFQIKVNHLGADVKSSTPLSDFLTMLQN